MIPFLSSEQIRDCDRMTIEQEPISSVDLMERAALAALVEIEREIDRVSPSYITVVCGIGNNGGDGLVIARELCRKGFQVKLLVARFSPKPTPDFEVNYDRLPNTVELIELSNESPIPNFTGDPFLVDALFGSGLTRPVSGWLGALVASMNKASYVVSIDIPSGLFSEDNIERDSAVKADLTVAFQVPKLAFILNENADYIGEWRIVPIGLLPKAIESHDPLAKLITLEDVRSMYRPKGKFEHKGTFGHALIAGGSKGMIGAVTLATSACLRSGVGLCTVQVPECGYEIVQSVVPEAMALTSGEEYLASTTDLAKFKSVGIGCGIGKKPEDYVSSVLEQAPERLVIDADALNILAENTDWLAKLPSGTVLTPHPGEFDRLFGKSNSGFERFQKLKENAEGLGIHIILKGAYTCIATPEGEVYVNPTGNPGMGTGGSGDVLTGLLTGLLAQPYSVTKACLLGVYIHGIAGDLYSDELSEEVMLSSDLPKKFAQAFKSIATA